MKILFCRHFSSNYFFRNLGMISASMVFGFFQTTLATEVLLSNYKTNTQLLCDGYLQLQIKTPEQVCVGLVASKGDGLRMPRYSAQTGDGTIYVTDMFGWAFARGTIFALEINRTTLPHKVQLVNLFPNRKLTMPNGIAADPEGRLYVGTPTGVFRFKPKDDKGHFVIDSPLEPVFTDLAQSIFRKEEYASANAYNTMSNKLKNKHPLVQIAANQDFTELYINIGAPSDDCASGIKTLNEQGACLQSDGTFASAAVWKIQLEDSLARKVLSAKVFSRGLRNSMALAVHPNSNLVFQGENGIDLPDENLPYEEINILVPGAHYGWPYCHSENQVSPKFESTFSPQDCKKKYQAPTLLMPAHTAPLGLLFPKSPLFPEFQNKLLVSWHGYQKQGHRVVAYSVDSEGRPLSNQFTEVMSGWEPLEGVRPKGAPTGLLALQDGSILIMDDKNSAILRLARGQQASSEESSTTTEYSQISLEKFSRLLPLLNTYCALCHPVFNSASPAQVLNKITGSLVLKKSPLESPLYLKIKANQMPPESIRSQLKFETQTQEQIEKLLLDFLESVNSVSLSQEPE